MVEIIIQQLQLYHENLTMLSFFHQFLFNEQYILMIVYYSISSKDLLLFHFHYAIKK